MIAADLDRIQSELLGDLVEMNFQRIARLRRAVPAFWTTWSLIRKSAQSLKLVTWHVISHSLQRSAVERAHHPITPVRATIEKRLKVHRSDRAVVLHTGFDFHQHRMPPAVTIKNFFTRQRHLHRATSKHRQLANHDFVIERITLASKAAAVWCRDHANVTGRQAKDFRQRTMHVVRRLR